MVLISAYAPPSLILVPFGNNLSALEFGMVKHTPTHTHAKRSKNNNHGELNMFSWQSPKFTETIGKFKGN